VGSEMCIRDRDGDDGFHRLLQETVHVLGVMGGNINADFPHHLDGKRMDVARWFRSGALHIELVA